MPRPASHIHHVYAVVHAHGNAFHLESCHRALAFHVWHVQGVGLSQAVSILQVVAGQVQGGHLDVSTAAVLLSTLIPGQLPLLQLAMAAEV